MNSPENRKFCTASFKRIGDQQLINGSTRLSLSFKDFRLESAYRQFILSYQMNMLRYSLSSVILVFALNALFVALERQSWLDFIFLFSVGNFLLLSLFFLFYVFNWKKFKRYQEIILLLQLYITVALVEPHIILNAPINSNTFYLVILVTEILMILPLVSRCLWKYTLAASLAINCYLNFRFSSIVPESKFQELSCLVYGSNFLLINLFAYITERFDRHLFFLREKDKNFLSCFQNLIKKVLPTAILIVKEQEIVYYNQEARRLLNVSNGLKLENQLDKVSIHEIKKDIKCFPSMESEPGEFENNEKNLQEYLTNYRNRDICGFQNLIGTISETPPTCEDIITENITRYLDIKIGTISWEGNEAQIVVFSEDLITQRLNQLAEQARYKDKLLATVSHDLRTPLNGVIGILELVMETVCDKATRKRLIA